MKIEFLGVPLKTIEDEIQNLLKQSDKVSIAVAFLKNSGIEKLEGAMNECLKNKGTISIITGFNFYFTEPEALRKLLEMNVNCKISFNENFHPKMYIFENKDNASIIIGSSNLSEGGLSSNLEANAILIGANKEQPIKDAVDFFSYLWSNGVILDEKIIKLYENERERTPKVSDFVGKGELNEYLSKISIANISVDKLDEMVDEGWENYEKGEMDKAYYNFKECISGFDKLLNESGQQDNLIEGKVVALIGLGHVNFQLNKSKDAINLANEAEEISDKKNSLIINLLRALSLGALTYYNFDKKISYKKGNKFLRIYDDLKKVNKEEDIDEIIGYSDLANLYLIVAQYNFDIGKKANAIINLSKSIKYSELYLKSSEGDSFGAILIYNKLGLDYQLKWQIMREPEPSESIKNFDLALDLAEKLKAKFWEAIVRRNLAYDVYTTEACDHLKKARKIFESLGHLELINETDEMIKEICGN